MARRIPPLVDLEATLARLPADFDLVQGFNGSWEYAMAAGWRYAKTRGLPFAATPFMHFGVQGQDRVARNSTMDHQKRILRDADALLALTDIERDGLIDWGMDGKRIHLIGGGIDAPPNGEETAVLQKQNLLDPYLIFVGRGSYDKGIIHAAQAVLALRGRGRRVVLAHVGQSSPEFDRFLRGLDGDQRAGIRPLGILSHEEKHALIAGSQALALPSRTDSFGLALLEAWTHGKPVIGARAGGIPSVIDENENGLLVPFGEAAALAAAMARLLDDGELRRRLGENGRLKTETVYSWKAVGEQVGAIYRQLVESK
jgi:glycosyltransferase involved in cell wall biosynthesis